MMDLTDLVPAAADLPTLVFRERTRVLRDYERPTALTLSPENFRDPDALPTKMWGLPITYDSTMAVGEFTLTH